MRKAQEQTRLTCKQNPSWPTEGHLKGDDGQYPKPPDSLPLVANLKSHLDNL